MAKLTKDQRAAMMRKRKRKLLGTTTQWVKRALYPNHVWSYDFVFDRTDRWAE